MKEKDNNPIGCCWLLLVLIALIVTVVLFTLRVTEQILISYWWVFSPILLVVGVPTLILFGVAVAVIIRKAAGKDE